MVATRGKQCYIRDTSEKTKPSTRRNPMKNIEIIKNICANATPDAEGSYPEQLAFWVKKLEDKQAKLAGLRKEVEASGIHSQWYTCTIERTEFEITLAKGEIINCLIANDPKIADTLFDHIA